MTARRMIPKPASVHYEAQQRRSRPQRVQERNFGYFPSIMPEPDYHSEIPWRLSQIIQCACYQWCTSEHLERIFANAAGMPAKSCKLLILLHLNLWLVAFSTCGPPPILGSM